MRRNSTLLATATLLIALGCGDNTVAPRSPSGAAPRGPLLSRSGETSLSTKTVSLSANGGSYTFGDLNLSYGKGQLLLCEGDSDNCSPVSRRVRVTVTFGIVNGAPAIDIDAGSDHVRFASPGAVLSTTYYADDIRNNRD